MNPPTEFTPTERAALVSWWLSKGEQLTTKQVADRLEMSMYGAWALLQRLARVLPITFDDSCGYNLGYWYSIQHYRR